MPRMIFLEPGPRRARRARAFPHGAAIAALAIPSITLLSLATGCAKAPPPATGERPPLPVETITVTARPLARTLAAVGTIESPQTAEIAAEVAGRIVALDVPEGETIAAGRLLARLDSEQPRARVKIAKARLEDTERMVRRARQLLAARVDTQDRLDGALIARDGAKAELEDAEAALEKTEIRSPFAGRLGLRLVDLGAFVAP
ncbi:MAG: efflux RND transporter periplasmic adaptor subunit [Myxococcales bacterium]|nr:efflux RND transporter periplasmic adaptor subunit [Myxococcales bacterium]